MINNISWQGYWYTLAVLLAIYYLVIGLLYYSADIRQLLSDGRKLNDLPDRLQEKIAKSDPELFPVVHVLIDTLEKILLSAVGNGYPKADLMSSLQTKLSEYPQLRDTAFQKAISNYIAVTAKNKCSIYFSEEDLSALWKRG